MNYLKRSIISAIENDIHNVDSYDIGVIIGERLKLLSDNNVEGCNTDEFLKGVQKGFQKASLINLSNMTESNERD